MDENQVKLIRQMQMIQFACIDFNLYLDTHPEDKRALADFNKLSNELLKIKKLYESSYGPLCNFGVSKISESTPWINGPWPWENEAN